MDTYKGPWAACLTEIADDDDDTKIVPKLAYALKREGVPDNDMIYVKVWSDAYRAFAYFAFSRQHVLMPPIQPWTPKPEEEFPNANP